MTKKVAVGRFGKGRFRRSIVVMTIKCCLHCGLDCHRIRRVLCSHNVGISRAAVCH